MPHLARVSKWIRANDSRLCRANGTAALMLNTTTKAICLALIGLGVSSSTAHAQSRKVYWAQATDDRIRRADLGGGAVESLVSFPIANGILDVGIDPVASKIIWAQSFESRIRRANFDGSSAETIVGFPNASGIVAVAVDPFGQKVYWAHTFDDQIKRTDFSGANIEIVLAFPVIADVIDIAIDPIQGKLYWAEALDGKIRRANLDGTTIEDIVGFPDVSGVVAIAYDPVTSSLYWAQTFNNRIRRIVIGDTDPVTVFEAPIEIIDLAVDSVDGKVLWTQADDTVWRADRLGENVLPSLGWPDVDGPLALATETLIPSMGEIPTVSQWGAAVMCLLLLILGTAILSRRQSASSN